MNHREVKTRPMAHKGRKEIDVVGMAGEKYDGVADDDG